MLHRCVQASWACLWMTRSMRAQRWAAMQAACLMQEPSLIFHCTNAPTDIATSLMLKPSLFSYCVNTLDFVMGTLSVPLLQCKLEL